MRRGMVRHTSGYALASSLALVMFLAAMVTGCGGNPSAPVNVSATASAATVDGGDTVTLTATVTNDKNAAGVSWSASSGTLSNTTTTSATLTAPVATSTAQTVTVTATSVADGTKTATVSLTVPAAPSITTTSLTSGTVGSSYTATLAGSGGISPYTWSLASGTLPSGLSLAASTGVVSGTPVASAAGTTNLTFKLTDSGAATALTATKSLALVIAAAPAITFSTTSLAGATFNTAYTASVTATGGAGTLTYSLVSGSLPAGLSLSAAGAISGTPTAGGSFSFMVKAADAYGDSATQGYSLTVTYPTLTLSPSTTALTATFGKAYSQSFTASGGSGSGYSFSLSAGASALSAAGLSFSGGTLSGTPTATGAFPFTVQVTDSASNTASLSYTLTISYATLTITPTSLPSAVISSSYSQTLTAAGGSGAGYTWSVTTGLSNLTALGLSFSGGVISGTPTATGSASFTVQVRDSASNTATQSYTLTVNASLSITSSTLPAAAVGSTYSTTLAASGGTGSYTWSVASGSSAPSGLTLSASGVLSGTPTTASGSSATTFVVQVTDGASHTATATLSITINAALSITTSTTLPNGYAGTVYSQTLAASGGTGTGYTWSVTSGSSNLSALNITLSSAGVLTGTPSGTGSATFTAQVKDSANNTATQSFTLTVLAGLSLPAPNPSSLGGATVYQSYTGSISASGGASPYTWTVNGSAVPTNGSTVALASGLGLSVSNNGSAVLNVTGTPTGTGTVTFTAKVADNNGGSAGPFTYTITVGTNYSISGSVGYATGCGTSGSVPVITMTLTQGTTTIQTTSTNNGNFTFSNIPNGNYTITPSITAGSAVFYPASMSVTVSSNNLSNENFSAALGYNVSGSVAYSGSKTGRIYVVLNNSNGNCSNTYFGTSLSSAGTWTIHGVAPGTYIAQAYLDPIGNGALNAADPSGASSSFSVSSAAVTGVSVAMSDPATVTLSSGPAIKGISAFNSGVLANYKPTTNSNGVETATSYTLQWSTSSSFATIAGSQTFTANGTHGPNIWFTNSSTLTNGTAYYFRAYATSAGTAQSPYTVYANNPVTIGAPAGSNSVSGSVTFSQTPTGPLYVGFYNTSTGVFYGEYFASPVSPQAFTVQVPTSTSPYYFVAFLDQANKGEFTAGVAANFTNGSQNPPEVTISGNVTGQNATVLNGNAVASVTTSNFKSITSSGTSQTYAIQLNANQVTKLPVSLQLATSSNSDGANLPTPLDIGACSFAQNGCGGSGFQFYQSLNSTSPTVGDTYTFNVTYSDGTTGTLTGTVTTVLNAFATNLSPTTGVSTSTTPTFTWTDPANASNYTYQFSICCYNNTIWQVPGQNSNSNGFSSSITSLTWGVDPTDGSNTPTTSLSTGTTYSWQIQVQDTNGNSATTQVNYQP